MPVTALSQNAVPSFILKTVLSVNALVEYVHMGVSLVFLSITDDSQLHDNFFRGCVNVLWRSLALGRQLKTPRLLMGRVFPVLRTFPIRVHPFVAVRCDSSSARRRERVFLFGECAPPPIAHD